MIRYLSIVTLLVSSIACASHPTKKETLVPPVQKTAEERKSEEKKEDHSWHMYSRGMAR